MIFRFVKHGHVWGVRVTADSPAASTLSGQRVLVPRWEGTPQEVTLGDCDRTWNGGCSAWYTLARRTKVV